MTKNPAPRGNAATPTNASQKGLGLSRQQFTMVATLLFGAVLVVLNQTLLGPALPAIMADMQVDATTVQWLTSGYALVEAIVIPLNAFFMGRFRTRQLFIGGLIAFAVGTVVAALAPVFGVILLGRMIQAASTGIIMPMVFTLILLVFPREKRGSAMGIVGLVIAFAPAIGPSVSGLLVDSVGWRALFVVVAVATVLAIVAAKVTLQDQGPFAPATFDKPSVVMLGIGMASFLYGLSSFSSAEVIWIPLVLMVVGLAFLAAFVKRQLQLETPLLKVDVLKARRFRTIACIVPFLQAMLVGSGVVMPIYIQSVMGLSATVSGLMMLPGAIIGALAGLLAGRIFDARGVRGIALIGGGLLAVAGVGLVTFTPTTSIWYATAVSVLMFVGLQCLTTPLNTWGVNSLDNRVIPHGNALVNTLNQVGAAFGTALIVSLTAFGTVLAPHATGVEAVYMGTHVSFIGQCAILVGIFVAIVLFVRNKAGEDAPKPRGRAGHGQGECAGQGRGPAAGQGASAQDAPAGQEAHVLNTVSGSDAIVAQVMNASPLIVDSQATVGQALKILAQSGTSGIVVTERGTLPVGFVSDGDVMRYLASSSGHVVDAAMNIYSIIDDQDLMQRAAEMLTLPVTSIATKHVVSVQPGDRLEHACRTLAEKRIKKVPVVQNGRLVGTLSRRNVVCSLSQLLGE